MDNKIMEKLLSVLNDATALEKEGICQFHVEGRHSISFYINLQVGNVTGGLGEHPEPGTTIKIPDYLMNRIISNPENWDHRDPEISSKINVAGDPLLLFSIVQAAKKPPAEALEAFARAEDLARRNPPITELQILENPTEREILECLKIGQPMLVRGALRGAAWTWDFDQLKQRLGHIDLRGSGQKSKETIGDFVDRLKDGKRVYSEGVPMPASVSPLYRLPYFGPGAFHEPRIWMGAKTGEYPCTPLHRDVGHAFLGQVYGRKRFLIYSPDQHEYVYPNPSLNIYQTCFARPWEPDYEKHPLFKKAKPIEAVVNPGELIITPSSWFHCVYALDNVISVSYFVGPDYTKNYITRMGI